MLQAGLAALYKFGGVGLAFLVLVVLARRMTPVEFGLYSVGYSIANIAWAIGTLGQPVSAVRFWPTLAERYGTDVANFVLRRGLLLVTLGSALIFALGLVAAMIGAGPFANVPLVIATAAFSVALAYSQYLCFALRARGLLSWSMVPRDLIWRGGVIVIAFFMDSLSGLGGLWLTTAVLAVATLAQLVRLVTLPPTIWTNRTLPPREEIEAMRYAQWGLYAGAISRHFLQQASTVVVALVLGPVEAGAFFAAQRLGNLMSLTLLSTNQVSSPLLAADWHAGRKDEVQSLAFAMALLATVASLGMFALFVLFGPWILTLFDSSYTSAYAALLLLAIGQLVSAACGSNANLLNLAGQERPLLRITVISGLLNPLMTAGGAMLGGLTGAALGTALAIILWNVLSVRLCKARLGIRIMAPDDIRNAGAVLRDVLRKRRNRKTAKKD
ncbi:Membrane protein involved in the export of O-antigen and teichoic acid [Palleronia marisminoris]|uniref:Polysaccharide biosynthesis protein n=1 Tax=Palleronia marisminoris TaxID=315423 RepID=A0A1Y5TXC8_9RHOB|nr:lipopolysaccharide biosynthesis protein [Palleronia marisminoris]SFH50048.1 Membrane protein involved in the export of O-antigen and teichoic acid [Palleronia marisminoris]SLN70300.1 Polysaccharide biosynthesis protein [Palleronia marisminoris]